MLARIKQIEILPSSTVNKPTKSKTHQTDGEGPPNEPPQPSAKEQEYEYENVETSRKKIEQPQERQESKESEEMVDSNQGRHKKETRG